MKSKNVLSRDCVNLSSETSIQSVSMAKWTEDLRHSSSSEGERVAEILLDDKNVGQKN